MVDSACKPRPRAQSAWRRSVGFYSTLAVGAALAAGGEIRAADAPISFANDVQPILTKAGCNQGACHGAQHGKGGFKLSLRGFDDNADYFEIVKSAEGRRTTLSDPTLSLLVSKPTLDIPHKGGKRLERDSWAYEALVKWIERGAPGPQPKERRLKQIVVEPGESILKPGDEIAVSAKAVYDDGSSEPIAHKASFDTLHTSIASITPDGVLTAKAQGETTVMVRYMGSVAVSRVVVPYGRAAGLDQFAQHNFIDKLWVEKWGKLGIAPSAACSDAEFFRRIHLDAIGTLPSPDDTRRFLADATPDKRNRAIDAVLKRPEYVEFWSYKWGDLLRSNRNELGDKGMWSYHNWIRASFRDNKPMDEFASELITAVGSPFQNGPSNFFKIGNNSTDWAENAAQVFMGVRMQCARCHQHPFENISQADFYGMAAFFARVGNKRSQEFGLFGQDSVIFVRDNGDVRHPRTGENMKPTPLGSQPVDDPVDRRRGLASWLCDPKNPALARNLANRYWGYFLGRGLVDPVDDIRVTNPASCPEVLDALTQDLIAHKYDVKHLIRTIMQSHVYQLSSQSNPAGAVDTDNKYFTRYTVKRLSAEQLLDAIDFACGTQEKFAQLPLGYRAIALPDANVASKFLDAFGRPKREIACECERSFTPNMTQALQFMTGNLLNRKVSDGRGRVAGIVSAKKSPEDAIADVYLATVSRPPTSAESGKAVALVKSAPSLKEGLEDLLWAMLNTREFQFNH